MSKENNYNNRLMSRKDEKVGKQPLDDAGFMPSPPNPSRVVLHDVNSFLTLSNALDSGSIISDAEVSLPALADEVAAGQKHQISELCQRQEYLNSLKDQHERVKQKASSVYCELKTLTRKVSSVEDDIDIKKEHVQQLTEDSRTLLAQKRSLTLKVHTDSRAAKTRKRIYDAYRDKMKEFKSKTDEFYQTSNACKKIDELREELKKLREEVGELNDLNVESENSKEASNDQRHINLLLESEEKLNNEMAAINSQVQSELEKQRIMKMEIETLKKRNNAQFLRLKKEVQEEQLCLRQLNEEVFKLKQMARPNTRG